jgi:hypothetical protein
MELCLANFQYIYFLRLLCCNQTQLIVQSKRTTPGLLVRPSFLPPGNLLAGVSSHIRLPLHRNVSHFLLESQLFSNRIINFSLPLFITFHPVLSLFGLLITFLPYEPDSFEVWALTSICATKTIHRGEEELHMFKLERIDHCGPISSTKKNWRHA